MNKLIFRGWRSAFYRVRETMNLSSGHRIIPPIGFGTWQTEDRELAHSALRSAIDVGYRFIDTAFIYKNEAALGEELQKILEEGKVKREELFVCTKLPANGLNPKNVEYFFGKSLEDLRLNYLDLYLIHVPIACQRTDDDYETYPYRNGDILTEIVDLTETWKVMESLVDKGLVRSIGLSNVNSRQIKTIYDAARIKPANVQVECHAYLPQDELYEFCKKLHITFTAYAPLGSPGLPDYVKTHYNIDVRPIKLLDDERLIPIAEKHKKSKAQILIRFLIEKGRIPIPKSTLPEMIKENFEVFDFSLDEEDMEVLRSMKSGFRYFQFDFSKSLLEHPEQPFNDSF